VNTNIFQREPVRVMNALFTALAGINAVLLTAGSYDGTTAGIITAIIALVAAFVNEVFTRSEVAPVKPLEELAAAEAAGLPPIPPP
jgi:hypothetical protein